MTDHFAYMMFNVLEREGPLSETLMGTAVPTVLHRRVLILLHKLGMR